MDLFLLTLFLSAANNIYAQTCGDNAVCSKTDTGFSCTCNVGFEGTTSGCVDINECATSTTCKTGETCTNTPGSYTCHCGDISNICANTADCVSDTCTCQNGYDGDGTTCSDVDECVLSNPCDTNANCTNNVGSFTCKCHSGYTGSGDECTDINECETGAHTCVSPMTCSNEDGTFGCTCGEDSSCHVNANCSASQGTSSCVCDTGYEGNGTHCSDINECDGTNDCHINADCTNLPGNYTCECKQGFTGDGREHCDDAIKASISISLIFLVLGSTWKIF